MEITDNEYLQQILKIAKVELREVSIKHRIAVSEFNIKSKMLNDQIDSIERQLANPVKNTDN